MVRSRFQNTGDVFADFVVLCEKPFTLTTAEADELISLASHAGLLLSVFHS